MASFELNLEAYHNRLLLTAFVRNNSHGLSNRQIKIGCRPSLQAAFQRFYQQHWIAYDQLGQAWHLTVLGGQIAQQILQVKPSAYFAKSTLQSDVAYDWPIKTTIDFSVTPPKIITTYYQNLDKETTTDPQKRLIADDLRDRKRFEKILNARGREFRYFD